MLVVSVILVVLVFVFLGYLGWCEIDKKMHSPDTQFTKWLNGKSDRMF